MHAFARGSTMLLLIGDFLTFCAALVLTLFVRYQSIPSEAVVISHLRPFFLIFVIWILVYLITGLYDKHISLVRKSIPTLVIRVQFINMLLAATIFFVFPFDIAPKTNLAIYLVLSTLLIALWRLYLYPLITTRKTIRALIVGDSDEAMAIARVMAQNPYFKHIKPYLLSKKDIDHK